LSSDTSLETGGENGQHISVDRFSYVQLRGVSEMNDELYLNERVQVIATFADGLDLCVPRRIRRSNGKEIAVTELGLRHPVMKGRRLIHVFEVTDGGSDYRLEFDAERLTWMLTREADHYE
jgi:hypothetical protein